MGQDSLDQIKDMLFDHEVSINNDQLWNAINQKKAIGNRLTIISSLAVAIVLLTAASLWYFSSNTNQSESESILNPVSLDKQDMAIQKSGLEPLQHESSIKETKTVETITLSKNSNSNTALSNSKISETTHSYSFSNNKTDYSTENNLTKTAKPINNQAISNNIIFSSEDIKAVATLPISDQEESSASDMANNSNTTYMMLDDVYSITGIDMNPLSVKTNQKKLGFKLSNDVECYDYRGKKNSIYAVAYTSADVIMKSLTSTSDFSEYRDSRESTESSLLSYHAGVQMKYLFDNGIYVKGGIEYGQVRERFSYRRTTEVTEILPGQIIQIDIQPNGDTTIVYGNAPVTTITMKNWRVGNNYKTLDFTALAGYQISKGSLVYSAELGASYNTSFSFSGLILDETGEPFAADNYFDDRVNWSVLGAFNVGYKLNSKSTIFTGMNFKHLMSPVNSSVNVVDQKYTRLGVHLGIEFKI